MYGEIWCAWLRDCDLLQRESEDRIVSAGFKSAQKSQLHAESTLITFSLTGASKTYPGVFFAQELQLEQPEQPSQTFHEGAYRQSCVRWHSPHTVSLQLLQTPLQLLLEKWKRNTRGAEMVDDFGMWWVDGVWSFPWILDGWKKHKKCCRLSKNIQHDSYLSQHVSCIYICLKLNLSISFWMLSWELGDLRQSGENPASLASLCNEEPTVLSNLQFKCYQIYSALPYINQSQLSRIEANNTYRNNIVKPKIHELLCSK